MTRAGWLLAGVLTASFVAQGCAFRRSVTNEGIQRVDKSPLVVGQSDWLDVMRLLALPPPEVPEQVGIRTAGRDLISYETVDTRCFTLGSELFLVITPFRWCSQSVVYRLSVAFDERGTVTSVYESTSGNYWPPFQDEDDAAPRVTRGLGGTPDP